MTKSEFQKLTEQPLLLDGATGSNLLAAGMPRGVSPERWVLARPEALLRLQRAYVDAGSQVLYAPTFGANRAMMASRGDGGDLTALNRALAALSREAAGGRALVAGDFMTTGRALEPAGEMTYSQLYDIYREQIAALAEAGVDLLVAETMMGVEETAAALDAARSVCDLAVLCSLSVEADGSALFDGSAAEAVVTLQEMGAAAVGVNCSVGPDQLEAVVAGMRAVAEVPVIAKPNAGMPVMTETGEALYSMGPEDFARHMRTLVDAGAGVVGGCCGTTPDYIRQVRAALGR